MTETLVEPPSTGAAGSEPFRPAPPDRGPGRLLRKLVGVREQILDWAPEDRPRYTVLGVVLINTGLMAALSMGVALHRLLGATWVGLVPVALFWGWVVLSIDRWMISSTHGVLGRRRLLMFAPRMALAIVVGVGIAEPLVLWIFHPAVHANVDQDRQAFVRTEVSRWRTCNPETGSTESEPACASYHLPIKSPHEVRDKLATLRTERTRRANEIGSLAANLERKQRFAQDECAGIKRRGTSGQEGKGFRCDSAWAVARAYEAEIDLPGKRTRLTQLDADIAALTGQLATADGSYATRIAAEIDGKERELRESFRPIDLVDEVRGMERLSRDSGFVYAAHWLVLLLLVLVDSLPVLAKMLGGVTTYDVLVHRQLQAGNRVHGRDTEVAEARQQADSEVALAAIDGEREAHLHQIGERSRTTQARHDEDLEDEIDRLAARYAEIDALEDPDDYDRPGPGG